MTAGRLSAAATVPHVRAALEGGEPMAGVCVLEVSTTSVEAERAPSGEVGDEAAASRGAQSTPSDGTETGARMDRSASPDVDGGDDEGLRTDRPASPGVVGGDDEGARTDRPASPEAPSDDGGGPRAGDHLLVWDDRHAGTLGGEAIDAAAVAAAREVLAGGRPGTRVVEGGGWRCTVYLEAHRAPPSLVIVGAGHIARPLCRVGAMLGFRVTVLDDRPEFATRERFPEAAEVRRADFSEPFRGVAMGPETHLVLVTRGHKYDFEALRDVLARPRPPRYVGMVGSQRRVRATLEQLAREGVPPERLRAVHAPVGLDVGAETPEEIAVAIAAEMVLVRRGGTGAPLRDRARVVERWVQPRG